MSEPVHPLGGTGVPPVEQQHLGLSDERIEGILGNLLRIGVLASALIVFAGGILYLLEHGRRHAPDRSAFERAETDGLRNPGRIVRDSVELHSLSLIMLGLLVLIATPVARVIFSVAAFALQRDFLYVIFTLIVLAVLLYSLFSGYL